MKINEGNAKYSIFQDKNKINKTPNCPKMQSTPKQITNPTTANNQHNPSTIERSNRIPSKNLLRKCSEKSFDNSNQQTVYLPYFVMPVDSNIWPLKLQTYYKIIIF